MQATVNSPWMTDQQLAGYIGVTLRSLWVKRSQGTAPKCHGRGRGVLTHVDDANAWVRNRGKSQRRRT